jgi:hypothetical protein
LDQIRPAVNSHFCVVERRAGMAFITLLLDGSGGSATGPATLF